MPHDAALAPGLRYAVEQELSAGEMKVLSCLMQLEAEGNDLSTANLRARIGISPQHANLCLMKLRLKNILKLGEKRGSVRFVS